MYERVKYVVVAIVVMAACFGLWSAYQTTVNLYGDWQFVRALRVRALQQQADRAQQQQQQAQKPRPPATGPLPPMPPMPPTATVEPAP